MATEMFQTILQESEYLEKFGAWSAAVNPDVRKKLTQKMIKRNDIIWELCKGERGYFYQLVVMNEFRNKYPSGCGNSDELFPEWDELLSAHMKYLQLLITSHGSSENYIVTNFGTILMQMFTSDQVNQLAGMYGRLLAQQDLLKVKIERHKNDPTFVQYLQECANNRSLGRKKLEDCFMVIYQRWTKVETQIQAITDSTLNDPREAEQLQLAREQVRSILQRAEIVLGKHINAQQLDHYRQHFEITKSDLERESILGSYNSVTSPGNEGVRAALEMWHEDTELIHFSKISVQFHPRSKPKDGHAVLLNDTFFVLEEVSDNTNKLTKKRYRLMTPMENERTSPILIRFGEIQGFFREMNESRANLLPQYKFQFLLILLEKESKMITFFCDTPDERTRWKNLLEAGFLRYAESPAQQLGSEISMDTDIIIEAGKQLEKRLELIAQKRQHFKQSLEDLEQLDVDLLTMAIQRRHLFQALFLDSVHIPSEDGTSEKFFTKRNSAMIEEYEKRLSDVLNSLNETDNPVVECCHEWVEYWNKQLRQLKLILCESGISLSRSVSNVERGAEKHPVSLRKMETFAGIGDTSIQDHCDGPVMSTDRKGQAMASNSSKNVNVVISGKTKQLIHEDTDSRIPIAPLQIKRCSMSTNSDYHSTSDGSFENVNQSVNEVTNLEVDDPNTKIYFHGDIVCALNEMHVAGVNTLKLVSQLHTKYVDLLRRHQLQTEEMEALKFYRQETETKVRPSGVSISSHNSFKINNPSGTLAMRPPHSSSDSTINNNVAWASTGQITSSSGMHSNRISLSEASDLTAHQEGGGVLHASAQSTERLRLRIMEFNKEKDQWMKTSKQEQMALEKARLDLKEEKSKFELELKKHNDEKMRLQAIIDMHNRRFGVELREELNAGEQSNSSSHFGSQNSAFSEEFQPSAQAMRVRREEVRSSMNLSTAGGNPLISSRSLSRDTLQSIESEFEQGTLPSRPIIRPPPSMPSYDAVKGTSESHRNRTSLSPPFVPPVRGNSESDMRAALSRDSTQIFDGQNFQRGEMGRPASSVQMSGVNFNDRRTATLTPNKQTATQQPSQMQQLPKFLASSTKVVKKGK